MRPIASGFAQVLAQVNRLLRKSARYERSTTAPSINLPSSTTTSCDAKDAAAHALDLGRSRLLARSSELVVRPVELGACHAVADRLLRKSARYERSTTARRSIHDNANDLAASMRVASVDDD
jgi:hypothetical protein